MNRMSGWFLAFAVCVAAQPTSGQFDFESGTGGQRLPRWTGTGDAVIDDQVAHGGTKSARIARTNSEGFSTATASVPYTFVGKQVELRGWLKYEDVGGFAGFWIRLDGESGSLAFDTLQKLDLRGTADWKQYSVKVPLKDAGRQIYFGFLLGGSGKAWADDLEILVDGKPLHEAPPSKRMETVIDRDKEFDNGSGVTLPELTPERIERLALLGKVWGFVKYHHPLVTAGEFHWDYQLFRVLPKVLAATNRAEAQNVLVDWLNRLGEIPACKPCAGPPKPEELHLRPRIEWIADEKALGTPLSNLLRRIHVNRPVGQKQFFIGSAMGAGNAEFSHEPGYAGAKLPDPGLQLLALYRFWNIIEYWSPYRNLIEEDWDGVMREFIPRLMRANSRAAYQRELLALAGRIHDSHTNIWGPALATQPPVGSCRIPAVFRFVENRAVAVHVLDDESGLQVGDIVDSLAGAKVADLVKDWSPYYPASNEPTRLRDIANNLGKGDCGEVKVGGERDGQPREWVITRKPTQGMKLAGFRWHERPGATFQRLSPDVVYLKMSSLMNEEVDKYVDQMSGAKAVILDSRSYPGGFTPFTLGRVFVDEPTSFARFTKMADTSNPGAFHFTAPLVLNPDSKLKFKGKVIVLVDEVSQSSSEYQTMAWSAGPRAKVIGSTTAAADGNVSQFPLPGGESTMISGIGVFYPDKRATQRIGIVPAIESKPTLKGIREGRDEVLERALREVLGAEVPEEKIVEMARHPKAL